MLSLESLASQVDAVDAGARVCGARGGREGEGRRRKRVEGKG